MFPPSYFPISHFPGDYFPPHRITTIIVPVISSGAGGGAGDLLMIQREQFDIEDEEMITVLMIAVLTGLLE